jgi:hypothetical protein
MSNDKNNHIVNNDNDNQDENDVSSQYYAANEALDVMIRPDQVHLRNFGAVATRAGNNKSILSLSMDSTQGYDVESNRQEYTQTSWKEYVIQFYKKDSLLIDVLLAILIAKIYPPLGAEFLFPEITAHWVAVIVIFCKYVCAVCVCMYVLCQFVFRTVFMDVASLQ